MAVGDAVMVAFLGGAVALTGCSVERGAVAPGIVDAMPDVPDRDSSGPDSDGAPLDSGGPNDAMMDSATPCIAAAESCNAVDDDCDDVIDEGAGCPCNHRTFARHAYLFCTDERATWPDARDFCAAGGRRYSLAKIDSEAENRFLVTEGQAMGGWWWMGATSQDAFGSEDMWVWSVDRAPLLGGYENWERDEPNNPMGVDEDCGLIALHEMGPSGIPGPWHSAPCMSSAFRFICESAP